MTVFLVTIRMEYWIDSLWETDWIMFKIYFEEYFVVGEHQSVFVEDLLHIEKACTVLYIVSGGDAYPHNIVVVVS